MWLYRLSSQSAPFGDKSQSPNRRRRTWDVHTRQHTKFEASYSPGLRTRTAFAQPFGTCVWTCYDSIYTERSLTIDSLRTSP